MAKPFAWSFSALNNFETCPKQYWHISIAKDYRQSTSDVGDYGADAHKALQNRIQKKQPFPLGLKHLEPFTEKFIAAPGTTYAEQKMALTRDYKPTEYFGPDVWLRSQMDAGKHTGSHFAVIDWKFGKVQDKWRDQGLIMTCGVFSQMPEVQTVNVAFVWWKEARAGVAPISNETFDREKFYHRWGAILPRVEKMEEAVAMTNFPARPNGLCRKYCPVTSCPHHGK